MPRTGDHDITIGQVSARLDLYLGIVSLTHQKQWTDDELMALPDDGKYEFVDGELVYTGLTGAQHGAVAAAAASQILAFANVHQLGHVFDGQTGFRFSNGNLRCPNISFVRNERLPEGVPTGFLYLAP